MTNPPNLLANTQNEVVISSRLIAKKLSMNHAELEQAIRDYANDKAMNVSLESLEATPKGFNSISQPKHYWLSELESKVIVSGLSPNNLPKQSLLNSIISNTWELLKCHADTTRSHIDENYSEVKRQELTLV